MIPNKPCSSEVCRSSQPLLDIHHSFISSIYSVYISCIIYFEIMQKYNPTKKRQVGPTSRVMCPTQASLPLQGNVSWCRHAQYDDRVQWQRHLCMIHRLAFPVMQVTFCPDFLLKQKDDENWLVDHPPCGLAEDVGFKIDHEIVFVKHVSNLT